MLDQMSGGRMMLGRRARHLPDRAAVLRHRSGRGAGDVRRGAGSDPARHDQQGADLRRRNTTAIDNVPMELDAVPAAASAALVRDRPAGCRAVGGANTGSMSSAISAARACVRSPTAIARNGRHSAIRPHELPLMGVGRHVVIAETRQGSAGDRPTRLPTNGATASCCCGASTTCSCPTRMRMFPEQFEEAEAQGRAVAGTAGPCARVRCRRRSTRAV